jgi:hypothetical protein
MNDELERVLDIGRNNENLAEDLPEAEAFADDIRKSVDKEFDDSYGEAELMATSK